MPATRRPRRPSSAARLALAALLASCASLRHGGSGSAGGPAASAQPEGVQAAAARAPEGEPDDPSRPMDDSEQVPVDGAPTLGPRTALVTLVVFSDFECPYCGRVNPTITRLRQRYGDELRVVFKQSPLGFHRHAEQAAHAALEAFAQRGDEGFWAMHDLLFANQRALERTDLERYAQQLQLDVPRFMAAIDARAHQQTIDADRALAARLRLSGTPGFAVNGATFTGARPFDDFVAAVEQALATARRLRPRHRVYAAMTANPLTVPERARPQRPARPELDPSVRYRVPVDGAPAQGPADALVTVVEFSDFECPYCGRVQPVLAQLRQRYGDDLRLVWRHMPLEFHRRARDAAAAAHEAFAQRGATGFWAMHDLLFQHQRDELGLERASFDRYALTTRLLLPRFRRALERETHAAAIDRDVALARALGVSGTPHFFLNGRRLVGARPLEQFVAAIDRELAEARALVAQGTPRAGVYEALTANGATEPVYRTPEGAAAPNAPNAQQAPGAPAPRYTVRENPRAPSRGPADAPVTLELFSDFQCPFCRRVGPTLDALRARFPRELRVRFRDYPLPFHPRAQEAAEAAREAYAQRGDAGFWALHDLLFANPEALERADLERYAQQAQLDVPRFRAALAAHTHAAAVRDDIAAGDATGAEMGTPAAFVNGRLVSGAQPLDEFVRVVEQALREARGANAPTP